MLKFNKIILNKITIYAVFLSQYLFGIIWLIVTGKASALNYISYEKLLLLRAATFLTYLILVYISYKGVKIVTWIMAVILMYTGLGATFTGIFRVEWHQYIMKSHLLIFGIYFIFGSIALFRGPIIEKQRFNKRVVQTGRAGVEISK